MGHRPQPLQGGALPRRLRRGDVEDRGGADVDRLALGRVRVVAGGLAGEAREGRGVGRVALEGVDDGVEGLGDDD